MIDLFQSANMIQSYLQERNWSFCFIGGIALQRWGEPRLTVDIDILLFTEFENDLDYAATLLEHFYPRVENALDFAIQNRVVLIKTKQGIGIDISLAGIAYEKEVIDRATYNTFTEEIKLLTCSAEDLIVMKAFADRDKDWGDVYGIIMRQATNLDWTYILDRLKPLSEVKENPGILDHLERIRISLGN
ncbi:nucleotidyl transferase AbiEii/AbiGii toxin family protein [candidate division KSB1 bacterium]|nr:nucleotidyl transferase AbiEii/AbiGii toxin family protein [candidate division KSB1 bacterium]